MRTLRLSISPSMSSCGAAFCAALLSLCCGFSGDAFARTCNVPDRTYATIQSAANDPLCSEIILQERIYTEQLTLGRKNMIIRGVGAGRTILVSPGGRARSTLPVSYLPNYTYVVQVKSGASATISDLTIDGASNARCGERYFGVRFAGGSGVLERVVIENVRGRATDFACANVIAAAVTGETGTPTGGATLVVRGATIRDFQQIALVSNGKNASLTVENTVIHGAGPQNSLAQIGVQISAGGAGSLDRATISDISYNGDPCSGGTLVGTGVSISGAAASAVKNSVLRGLDRGILLSKNTTGAITVSDSRFVETSNGILSTDNVAASGLSPIVTLSKNGFVSTKRNSAADVATCFDESGDAIAVRSESGSVITGNAAADSSRCAIELLSGTTALDVNTNQAVRSSRADIEDKGTMNHLSKNLCLNSTPAGLCEGAP